MGKAIAFIMLGFFLIALGFVLGYKYRDDEDVAV